MAEDPKMKEWNEGERRRRIEAERDANKKHGKKMEEAIRAGAPQPGAGGGCALAGLTLLLLPVIGYAGGHLLL